MHLRVFALLASILLLAGCASTPQSRIDRNRATFATFPPEVQQRVAAGQIDIGYTEPMVLLALGEPVRRVDRVDQTGTSQVWIYARQAPRVSFGFGFGSYGRHSSFGTGVSVGNNGYYDDEAMRVEFQQGRVSRIDYRKG